MSQSTSLALVLSLASILAAPPLIADEIGSLLAGLEQVDGTYHGEVRLQTSDGSLNRVIVPDAQITLKVEGNQLIVSSGSDLVGKGCASQVIGIRELTKFPSTSTKLLEAVFDFNPGNCFGNLNTNALLILVERVAPMKFALETLLVRTPYSENRTQLSKKTFVHGYFQRKAASG